MGLQDFNDGQILYGGSLDNMFRPILSNIGMNMIRELQATGSTNISKGIEVDGWAEAYVNLNGRNASVQNYTTGSTDAVFIGSVYTKGGRFNNLNALLIGSKDISDGNFSRGLHIDASGNYVFAVVANFAKAVQYAMTTPGDIKTVSGLAISGLAATITSGARVSGFHVDSTGSRFYAVTDYDGAGRIYQYKMTTAWNLSTGSYDAKNLAIATGIVKDIHVDDIGSRYYILNATGSIIQYKFTTAWDITTGSFTTRKFLETQETGDRLNLWLNNSGNTMYVLGSSNYVYQYNLSDPWNVDSAVFSNRSFNTVARVHTISGNGLAFLKSGSSMYVIGSDTSPDGLTHQYSLQTGSGTDIVHTLPSGNFNSSVTTAFGQAMFNNWESGAGIQYMLIGSNTNSGWLSGGVVSIFSALSNYPDTLKVRLVQSPTATYDFPSIRGFYLLAR